MQEESKSTNHMKVSIQKEFENSAKGSKIGRGWSFSSFRSFLICCDSQNHDEEPVNRQKHANSSTTAHYSAGDPISFINNSKRKDSGDRFGFSNQANAWAKNELFLLGKGSRRVMCKLTKTNLNCNPCKSTESLSPERRISDFGVITLGNTETRHFTRQEIFSLYSQGIRVEKSDWNEVTPECIAKHIACRLSGKFVIDALSGYGGNAIQFARRCPYVIGVEIEAHKIKKAEHNSGIYHVNHKIDLIHADFFSLKKLFADVVFLAPSEVHVENTEKFSIQKHLSPNLTQLIKHSLSLSKSLCIMLPPSTNIEELATVFCDVFDENPQKYDQFDYTLELDLLYLEDTLVSIVVFFGEINNINFAEKRDLLIDLANLRENRGVRTNYSENFCNRLFKKVGFQRSLMILLSLEEEMLGLSEFNGSIFEAFLGYLREKNILSSAAIYKLQQTDMDSRAQSSVHSSRITGISQPYDNNGVRSSGPAPNNQSENFHQTDGLTPRTQRSSKKSIQVNSNRDSQHIDTTHEIINMGVSYDDQTHNNLDNTHNSLGKPNPPQLDNDPEPKELNENSPAHSDMDLSSYSMKSAALLDSFSDNEAQYMLSYNGEQSKTRNDSIGSIKKINSLNRTEANLKPTGFE